MKTTLGKIGEVLTRDYVSPLDPLIKWVRHPAAILGMTIATSLLCGVFLHPRAFVLASGLAAVMALGLSWPWVSAVGLSGSLSFDHTRAREGETRAARLIVRNRLPWTAWGLYIRGALPVEMTTAIPSAAGWRGTEASWEFTPACRGVYPRGELRIASGFPFGLREFSRPLSVSAPLLVWPRTFPVGPLPEAATGESGDGLATRNKSGSSGDLLGVRPYRRGDSVRRVHWPQTARLGELVVCELQSLSVPRAQVVLDLWTDEARPDPDGLLEWSIRVAASFAEQWSIEGAEVELVAGRQVIAATSGMGRVRADRILDALARLEPTDWRPLQSVLDGPGCRRFQRGLRIVVTSDVALAGLERSTGGAVAERFVVLKAGAFGDRSPGNGPTSLLLRPWIQVDDAGRVPQIVRSGWREVSLGR